MAFVIWLAWNAPLSYDEAYNWITYRPHGWFYTVTTYDLPNNHVPFTLLHSLIPGRFVAWSPWTLRIFAVGISAVLMAVLAVVAVRRQGHPLLPIALALGSPLLVAYLAIARSYTFCGLLAVLAAIATATVTRRGATAALVGSGLALAVASWALPTNGFIVPGWILMVVLLHGMRRAVLATAVYGAASVAMFLPIFRQVLDQSKVNWAQGSQSISHLPGRLSFVPVLLFAVAAAVAAHRLASWRRMGWTAPRDLPPFAKIALAASVMAVSFLIVLLAALMFGMQSPFQRNGIPAVWLLVLAAVAGFPRRREGVILGALLAVPLIAGSVVVASAAQDGRWGRLTVVLETTTPSTIRDLHAGDADLIECSSFDSPVCLASIPMLAKRGITVSLADYPFDPLATCVKGSTTPPEPYQVWVYRGGVRLGKLCN